MKIIANTSKTFRAGSTYIFSINNEIETIVECKETSGNIKIFEATDTFELKLETYKYIPSKTFVFISKSNEDFLQGVVTLKISDIEFEFNEED